MIKTWLLPSLLLAVAMFANVSYAQEPNVMLGGQGGQRMQGTAGTITEIKGDTMTLKTFQGEVATVKTTSETAFRRDREAAKLADFKTGETIFVGGEPDGKDKWTARFVAMRSDGPGGPMRMNPEDMGKKFIAGEVTKIDETKLTVKRPDGVVQVIEVDEETSFRNAKRESVTLADIKVGDHIAGRGELKDGTFVPKVLNVGMPQGGRMMFGAPPTEGAEGQPKPATQDKQEKR